MTDPSRWKQRPNVAFYQIYCMHTFTAATRPEEDNSEFYAYLDAYSFPEATITQAPTVTLVGVPPLSR